MSFTTRTTLLLAFAAGSLVTGRLSAATFEPILYELREGSILIDDCLLCDRAPIEAPIEGSFILTRAPVRIAGELYTMSGIDFSSVSPKAGEYTVRGSGSYYRRTEEATEMTLDLEVNDASGVKLSSGTVPSAALFPKIDIKVTEDGQRDLAHRYTIHFIASPRPNAVRYELIPGSLQDSSGSFFVDDCTICERPTFLVPVAGTFILVDVEVGGPNPFNTYKVESVDVSSAKEGFQYHIAGEGKYAQGGEVALEQEMDLMVQVNDDTGVELASGRVGVEAKFPAIDIQLQHKNPSSPLHVYSLHIVAKPSEAGPQMFHRGDSNGDGNVDISDAIHLLLWQFAGGETPGCIDAADANDDEKTDLSDAVYLLDFLFKGGAALPAPGAEACGLGETPSLGCDSYPSC